MSIRLFHPVKGGSNLSIFFLLLQKSLIDPSSEEGEKPEKFDGSVEFKDIFFSYPTRSDVEVRKKIMKKEKNFFLVIS